MQQTIFGLDLNEGLIQDCSCDEGLVFFVISVDVKLTKKISDDHCKKCLGKMTERWGSDVFRFGEFWENFIDAESGEHAIDMVSSKGE